MLKSTCFGYKNFSTRKRPRRPGSAGPPNVNLGFPKIYETTRDRKLKLKMPFDIVKYPLRVQFFSARGRSGDKAP